MGSTPSPDFRWSSAVSSCSTDHSDKALHLPPSPFRQRKSPKETQMPRFGKNVLSQYLRTKCDKQLRLSLFNPTELQAMNWPVPLTARPAVQILRDVGI